MTDLNAKIIPLRTETASLAPTAVQLDVGEIATNLEDGLIYSKKTDGTVVTLGGGGGGGGDLDGLTDVDVSTVAPADGQSLVWDSTAERWVPGVPGTRIQDATDFELNESTVNAVRFPTFLASGNPEDEGEWQMTTVGVAANSLSYSGAGGLDIEMGQLQVGDVVTIQWSDGSTTDYTIDQAQAHNSGVNGKYIKFTTDHTVPPAVLSGELIIFSSRFSNPIIAPLAEGELLKWDSTAERWVPGVPEMRIQEASDFELNQIPAVGYTYSSAASVSGEGYPGWASNSGTTWIFNEVDSNGTNLRDALLLMSTGDKFWWSFDNGFTFEEFTVGLIISNLQNGRWEFRGDVNPSGNWAPGNDTPWERGEDWHLFLAEPAGTQYVPLAEGDILQWDDDSNTFRPAQQSLFELNQTLPAGLYEFTSCADAPYRIPSADYEWGVYNGELRIWQKAADGIDLRSVFDTLPGTGSVWWSNDGISFTEATYTSLVINNDGAANEYLRLQSVTPLPTTLSGSLFVKFTQPGAPIDVPLADGDILQWDDDDQAFRPHQLTAADIGDLPEIPEVPESIDDLSDVDTSTTAPIGGQALVWNNTASKWEPGTPDASGQILVESVQGKGGNVRLTIQEMDDFEKNSLVASSHRYTLMPDTDAAWPTVAAGQYAVASDGSWLRFNYEDADGNTVAFTASADIWTTTNLAGSWTTGDANTTQDTTPGVRYFFRSAGAAISADLGATTYLSLIDPAAPTYATLAEGDILQWADADQKFKPQNFSGLVGAVKLNDLQDVEALAPSNGQVLTYDEPNSEWIASTSTIDALADVDTTTASPATGQALTWDGSNWTPGMAVDDLGRITVTHSIPSLAQNASEDVDQSGVGTAGIILNLTTDVSCWVVAYVSKAARTADGSRLRTEDPESGSGVVAEFVTSGAETVIATPPPTYFNGEASPVDQIYLRVTNLGVTAPVTYDLTVSRTEP